MSDEEKQLRRQIASLQESLTSAHEMLAKNIYKLGVVAALVGFPPDATHLQITNKLKELGFPKS
jgi:hypothetical protein